MKMFITAFIFLFSASLPKAAEEGRVLVGAASVDITPEYPIRLSGYGSRRAPSVGVTQKVFGKALALGSAERGDLALIITVDNLGIPAPMTEEIHRRIAAEVTLRREQFAVCASHTHAAPMLSGMISNLFGMDIPLEQWEVINRYTAETTEKLVKAGLEAIRGAQPAELFWGMGRAGFAKNRRTEGGPVDHDAPILAARADGKWIAVLVNYACHCTTLGGEFNKVCGDWAGYAQGYIEERFPGAKALVAIGCGGDANPFPRGTLANAQDHGRELATEVERLLKSDLKPLKASPKGALTRFNLAFDALPMRAHWEETAKRTDAIGYHAKRNLARLERGETLPTGLEYSLQVMVFGDDLAMVFMPGEVVVDYSLRIKRAYAAHRVWVNAYSNDDPCYIPSKRILAEGGYEGGGAMVYYDRPTKLAEDTEERIFANLEKILPVGFKVEAAKEEKPVPKSPSEALKTFRLKPGLEIDLIVNEPLVIDPVAIDFGADGRLWVAEMHDYPSGLDGNFKPGGRIKVLSSSNNSGKFDRAQMLVDDVPFPTGLMAWRKGALVCAAPDILYIEDTDGDGKADVRKKLYSGFATHNYQARVNGLRWGLDGWVYGAAGLFGGTIHSHITGKDVALSGRDFRIRPDTGEFEVVGGLSQQGRVRDDFGNWFGCDNGMWMWHFPLEDRYLARNAAIAYPETRVAVAAGPNANQVFPASVTLERFNDPGHANHTTSACGIEVYRDTALGRGFYHNAFVPEPVHNLVHRLVVKPNGTTFTGLRAENETRAEFLTSTDNWFRPVETRTGPEGALWVVDMYRNVIEHPRWISSNRLAQLDVRAGEHQGRIYRVRSSGRGGLDTWANLTQFTDNELTQILAGDNGVLRDLAHRLLLERGTKEIGALREIVGSLQSDGARLQALYLLEQLKALDDSVLKKALRDKSAPVRSTAIKMAEQHPALVREVAALVKDTDAAVRLQLALSLGEFNAPEAGAALGRIAAASLGDARMRYAVLSSSTRFPAEVLAAVIAVEVKTTGRREMVDGLIRTAAAGDEKMRAAVLDLVLPKENEAFDVWRLEAANTLIQAGAVSQRLERVRAQARTAANDEQRDLRSRQVALEILGRSPLTAEDFELFGNFLNRAESVELQTAALNGLKKSADTRVADLMLTNWNAKAPGLRAVLIDELLQREPWTERLLEAIRAETVSRREIDATQRERLIRSSNKSIAERARKLVEGRRTDRVAVMAGYANVGELTGNLDRGLELFARNCAACHSVRGLGFAVGPDLVTYRDQPASDFVIAILNPNAAVEPRFINYQVDTKDDRSLSGILTGETASSLTMVGPNGVREALLRAEVKAMRASGFSMMPEGFEGALTPQGMADLIAYMKGPTPIQFGSARSKRPSFPPTRVTAATETLEYPSPFGTALLHHCRQSDGNGRVEWETMSGVEEFVFPVAVGHKSQPRGKFTFFVNDKKAFDFDVTLTDALFGQIGGIHAVYRALARNAEDSSGMLSVTIPATERGTNTSVRFAVTGSAADSQRWFGIYSFDRPTAPPVSSNADIATVAAAMLDDSKKNPDRERLINDNAARSAELLRALTQNLSDGREQNRRIPWIWRVAMAAGRRNETAELARVLDATLPRVNEPLQHWQAVVIGGGIVNGISLNQQNPDERIHEVILKDKALAARWQWAIEQALPMAADESIMAGTRYDALRMIAMLPWAHAQAPLARNLERGANGELQQGSVSGLLDVREPAAWQLLLERFGNLTEANQKLALETLEKNPARRKEIRSALEAKQISEQLVTPELRAVLQP